MAYLSWVPKHIKCMHYFKQVVSTYVPIPAYHMYIKHGQADYAGSRLSWCGQTQLCFIKGAFTFSRPPKSSIEYSMNILGICYGGLRMTYQQGTILVLWMLILQCTSNIKHPKNSGLHGHMGLIFTVHHNRLSVK